MNVPLMFHYQDLTTRLTLNDRMNYPLIDHELQQLATERLWVYQAEPADM